MFSGITATAEALLREAAARPGPIIVASILAALVALLLRGSALSSQPGHFLNPKGFFELSLRRARDNYMANARKMMLDWFAENPEKPVTMLTDTGFTTILPPSMANEIRNDDRLNFAKVAMRVSRLPALLALAVLLCVVLDDAKFFLSFPSCRLCSC